MQTQITDVVAVHHGTVLFVENRPVGSRSVSRSVSSRSTVGRSVSQSAASLCNAIIEASSLCNRYYAVKI